MPEFIDPEEGRGAPQSIGEEVSLQLIIELADNFADHRLYVLSESQMVQPSVLVPPLSRAMKFVIEDCLAHKEESLVFEAKSQKEYFCNLIYNNIARLAEQYGSEFAFQFEAGKEETKADKAEMFHLTFTRLLPSIDATTLEAEELISELVVCAEEDTPFVILLNTQATKSGTIKHHSAFLLDVGAPDDGEGYGVALRSIDYEGYEVDWADIHEGRVGPYPKMITPFMYQLRNKGTDFNLQSLDDFSKAKFNTQVALRAVEFMKHVGELVDAWEVTIVDDKEELLSRLDENEEE